MSAMRIGKIKIGKNLAKKGMLFCTVGLGFCLYMNNVANISVPLIALSVASLDFVSPVFMAK